MYDNDPLDTNPLPQNISRGEILGGDTNWSRVKYKRIREQEYLYQYTINEQLDHVEAGMEWLKNKWLKQTSHGNANDVSKNSMHCGTSEHTADASALEFTSQEVDRAETRDSILQGLQLFVNTLGQSDDEILTAAAKAGAESEVLRIIQNAKTNAVSQIHTQDEKAFSKFKAKSAAERQSSRVRSVYKQNGSNRQKKTHNQKKGNRKHERASLRNLISTARARRSQRRKLPNSGNLPSKGTWKKIYLPLARSLPNLSPSNLTKRQIFKKSDTNSNEADINAVLLSKLQITQHKYAGLQEPLRVASCMSNTLKMAKAKLNAYCLKTNPGQWLDDSSRPSAIIQKLIDERKLRQNTTDLIEYHTRTNLSQNIADGTFHVLPSVPTWDSASSSVTPMHVNLIDPGRLTSPWAARKIQGYWRQNRTLGPRTMEKAVIKIQHLWKAHHLRIIHDKEMKIGKDILKTLSKTTVELLLKSLNIDAYCLTIEQFHLLLNWIYQYDGDGFKTGYPGWQRIDTVHRRVYTWAQKLCQLKVIRPAELLKGLPPCIAYHLFNPDVDKNGLIEVFRNVKNLSVHRFGANERALTATVSVDKAITKTEQSYVESLCNP